MRSPFLNQVFFHCTLAIYLLQGFDGSQIKVIRNAQKKRHGKAVALVKPEKG